MQYRRLTAHLQTGSADFNRRLAAYLTNQVAMRSAVEQMTNNPYSQQFAPSSVPYSPQPRQNMFQTSHLQQQQHQMHQPVSTPGSYRQAPYPSPHQYRNSHGRAYSAAVVPTTKIPTVTTPSTGSLDHRRMSTPATIPPQIDTTGLKSDPEYMRQTQSAQVPPHPHFNPYWQDASPFTTTLPAESQQMLAGVPMMDHPESFPSGLMTGSEQYLSNPYYPWANEMHNAGFKQMPTHMAGYRGMSATLAPSALSTQAESVSATPTSTHPPTLDGFSNAHSDPLGLDHMNMSGKGEHSPPSMASGQNTPGESFWSNFVQDGGWTDELIPGN